MDPPHHACAPGAEWENWLTGEHLQGEAIETSWRLPAGRVLSHFPVALLLGVMDDRRQ